MGGPEEGLEGHGTERCAGWRLGAGLSLSPQAFAAHDLTFLILLLGLETQSSFIRNPQDGVATCVFSVQFFGW